MKGTHTRLGHRTTIGYFIPFWLPYREGTDVIHHILRENDRLGEISETEGSTDTSPFISSTPRCVVPRLLRTSSTLVGGRSRTFLNPGSQDVDISLLETIVGLTRLFSWEGVSSVLLRCMSDRLWNWKRNISRLVSSVDSRRTWRLGLFDFTVYRRQNLVIQTSLNNSSLSSDYVI